MARPPRDRARQVLRLLVVFVAITAAREAAFRRNDRRHPVQDPGRAP